MGAGWGRSEASTCSDTVRGRGVRAPRRSHSWTEGPGRPEQPGLRGGGAAAGSTHALPAPKPRPRSPTPAPRSRPRGRAGVTVQPAGSGSSRAGPAGHAQCGGAAAAGGADSAVRTAAASVPRRRTCPRDLTTGAEVSARGSGRTGAAGRGEKGRERDGSCSSPAPPRGDRWALPREAVASGRCCGPRSALQTPGRPSSASRGSAARRSPGRPWTVPRLLPLTLLGAQGRTAGGGVGVQALRALRPLERPRNRPRTPAPWGRAGPPAAMQQPLGETRALRTPGGLESPAAS